MSINDYMESIRPSSWFPSIKELLLFAMIAILLISMIFLFHYSGINNQVRKTSRCVREQNFRSGSGQYVMTAVDPQNNPLYKVTYDLSAKSFDLACACKDGNIVNRFTNIKVFNQKNPNNPNLVLSEKLCQCNQAYDQMDKVYYTGYPGVLRYYDNGDTSFFNPRPY